MQLNELKREYGKTGKDRSKKRDKEREGNYGRIIKSLHFTIEPLLKQYKNIKTKSTSEKRNEQKKNKNNRLRNISKCL